ncbi:caspase family protein [Arcicella sp. DC2W]|uniref:Caspase family protein n=1 Tax=Arcicella gelida TaxID=2984195 RepID=A0ABU5S7D6_9BACT|nr:caspase family protein [Arcicella sp. DC2W]MEA5404401.1 caspase family protein [Arcicella sp. DC2W]
MFKKNKGLLIILVLICFQGATQSIRTILIADSKHPELGKTYERNLVMMDSVFSEIAKNIHYDYLPIAVYAHDFTEKDLDREILHLPINTDDVIVFYYVGRGLNPTHQTTQFPSIFLKDTYLQIENIHQKLNNKGVKLNITLIDCNNQQTSRQALTIDKPLVARSIFVENDILRKLFKESKGNIIISSSKKNEKAYGSTNNGTYYTIAWLEALSQAENNNVYITWDSFLKDAELRLQEKLAQDNKNNLQHSQWQITTDSKDPITPNNTPTVSFNDTNLFLNTLANEKLKYDKREKLMETQMKKFFNVDAEANEYINAIDNNMSAIPIEDFLNKILINANLIKQINVVENLSTFSQDGRYQIITIQEIR